MSVFRIFHTSARQETDSFFFKVCKISFTNNKTEQVIATVRKLPLKSPHTHIRVKFSYERHTTHERAEKICLRKLELSVSVVIALMNHFITIKRPRVNLRERRRQQRPSHRSFSSFCVWEFPRKSNELIHSHCLDFFFMNISSKWSLSLGDVLRDCITRKFLVFFTFEVWKYFFFTWLNSYFFF